jgi:glutamate-1-semialdehyde 2,1-aminomutase
VAEQVRQAIWHPSDAGSSAERHGTPAIRIHITDWKALAMSASTTDRRNADAASAEIYRRAQAVMPGGSTRATLSSPAWAPHPPYAVSGKGCRVVDADGHEIIDFANNFYSLIHGHAHPEIVAAVQAQAAKGLAFGLPTELDVRLAEIITARAPGLEQIRFCNSGTEAVLFAIKAARAFTGRWKIAKMEGGYHGAYDPIEISLDSEPEDWGDAAAPRSVSNLQAMPQSVRDDTVALPFNDLPVTLALIERHADQLAAVVIDPLPSRIGLIPATTAYLEGLQAACRRFGIMLVVDEIVCFRLHSGGAQTLFGISPDYTALGKIIGGGQPIGAIAGPRDRMAVFDSSEGRAKMPQGGTFSANPITMAAGIASMTLLTNAEFARLDRLGERLRHGMQAAIKEAGCTAQVTGMGSLFKLHMHDRPIRNYRDAYPSPQEAATLTALFRSFLANGILVTPQVSGALSTPMTDSEIDMFLAVFRSGLAELGT